MMFDKRILLFVILCLALLHDVLGSRRRPGRGHVAGYGGTMVGRPCTRSSDCVSGNQGDVSCCTDISTGLVIDPDLGTVDSLLGLPQGVCTRSKSRYGQFCNSTCGCTGALECYRRQTGFCCAAKTCLTKAEVKEDKNRPPPP